MAFREPCTRRSPVSCTIYSDGSWWKNWHWITYYRCPRNLWKIFNEGTEFQRDGSQFDKLVVEGDTFHIGQLRGDVLHTPGHTPACMTYVIGDAAFVGDTLFMPDFGTARCDFPGGSSENLFSSIQKILSLPDATRIFVGHDYKAPGREHYAWETTVGEQKKKYSYKIRKIKEDFVKLRDERDAKLAMPKLIVPSLQINMRPVICLSLMSKAMSF